MPHHHLPLFERRALSSAPPPRPPETVRARAQLEFLQKILDALDRPFYVIRPEDHSIVLANKASRASGIEDSGTCHALTHRRDSPCEGPHDPCPLEMARTARAGVTVEHVHYRVDGTQYVTEVHGYPIFDETGEMEYFVEYSLDITTRKRAEEQLRMFQRAFEHSASGVLITRIDGVIEYVNPACERISGYSADELLGRRPSVLKSGKQSAATYAQLWATIARGDVWRGEVVNLRKSGEYYWEHMTIAPVRDALGMVTYYVAVKEDISERKKTEEHLALLASTDSLTGLWNRRHFFENAAGAMDEASRSPAPVAALMLDIDHFKHINDTLGHACGDFVLRTTAARLRENVREGDLLARVGGEEFAVLLRNAAGPAAREVAERLRDAATAPIQAAEGTIHATVSVGVACSGDGAGSIDDLLRRADRALYAAKHNGRNRVETDE